MPYTITRFEPTPNPNAIKCMVEPSPGPVPRSYFNAAQVDPADDPLASALFQIEGVKTLLIHTRFITVNKSPDAPWPRIKKAVEATLTETQH
jgi:hypothetical protein